MSIIPNVARTESGGSVTSTVHHSKSSSVRVVLILQAPTRSWMHLAIICLFDGGIHSSPFIGTSPHFLVECLTTRVLQILERLLLAPGWLGIGKSTQ